MNGDVSKPNSLVWAGIIIPAITSIICAFIASGVVLKNTSVVVSEDKSVQPNVVYTADRAGFVTAFAEGTRHGKRRVEMSGWIDGRKVASTIAADDTVGISISATSISIPIRNGAKWSIQTNVPTQVTITWFSAEPKGWFW